MSAGASGGASRVAELPELNVAFFSFLLNFVWEFFQVPFFRGMADAPHWQAAQVCIQATLGDAGISLVAFWAVALAARSRGWVLHPTAPQLLGFVAVGVGVTIPFEWLATEVLDRWTYADSMPTLPLLGTGLLPILQWIVLPPAVAWLVRRQLT
jgi:hypothetical protein